MRAALARTDHSLKKLCWSSASIAAVQRADEHRSCTCETRGVCNNHQRKRYVRMHREKTANYICTGSCPGLLPGSCTTTLHCFMHLESERGNGQAHEFPKRWSAYRLHKTYLAQSTLRPDVGTSVQHSITSQYGFVHTAIQSNI